MYLPCTWGIVPNEESTLSAIDVVEEFDFGDEGSDELPTFNLDFGEAIHFLKEGKKLARAGWNGKGMWVRMIDLYTDREFHVHEAPDSVGTWTPFIVMKTPGNTLHPWNASQADALANDWEVVE